MRLENIPILPYSKAWVGGPDHTCIPEHGRIQKGDQFEDTYPGDDGPLAPVAGHWLYAGPMKHHFGHILVDSIIRLHAYDPPILILPRNPIVDRNAEPTVRYERRRRQGEEIATAARLIEHQFRAHS